MLIVDIHKELLGFNLNVAFKTNDPIVALLGASGSGKSLTLKCIAGIEKPDRGKIILNGRVLFDSEKNINLKAQDRGVAYLFQNYALFPTKTVYENIRYGIPREDKNKSHEIIKAIIEKMKLKGLEKRKPDQLSGGQQQRVALARILVNKPEILLLDEPFSALDSFLKWDLAYELEELLIEYGLESILVTHDEEEVIRLADEVCVLSSGKSENIRPVEDLFRNPETKASAVLAGIENFSSLSVVDGRIIADDWGADLGEVDEFFKSKNKKDIESFVFAFRNDGIGFENQENCFSINSNVTRIVKKSYDLVDLIVKVNNNSDKLSKINITIHKDFYNKFLKNIKIGNNIDIYIDKKELILLKG